MEHKTDKEWEHEQEQLKLLYALKLGSTDSNGICLEKCDDIACDGGCLQQPAKQFRPQIMQGVKIYRDRGYHKYPLYAEAAFHKDMPCEKMTAKKFKIICNDPVCQVVGCMERPAWQFRDLIYLARQEELINQIKK